MFPEDALTGKAVDGWGVDPGIAIRTEKTGSESINNDNDGTGHIRGSAGYGISGSDQKGKLWMDQVLFPDCEVVCSGINATRQ